MKSIGEYFDTLKSKIATNESFHSLMKKAWNDPDVIDFIEQNKENLTPEAIERSAANLYEFVTEKEKFQHQKGEMIPGHYPKLVLHNHFIEVTYVPTQAFLEKEQADKARRRVHTFYLPSNLIEARLDYFDQTPGRMEAFLKALDFLEDYRLNANHNARGLYFYGGFGVGKTYLMGALANELADFGTESILVHYPTFTTKMKESIGNNTTHDLIEQFQRIPVLFLDDIGAEANSSWLRDDILGVILQYRMQECLPTFFSSNQNMSLLEEHFAGTIKGDVEPVKAARIMERVRFLSEEVTMEGYNRRNPS
ncbi:primosomal protein DnaI [Allofustis seminis]|uniref:primosomal protein DnaI n=1 Tax=Allofustis seminis TaxID=166939 RepID=UPI0003765DF8|nr:primosomal protein DnaI [Allofustis seminis]